MQLEIVTVVVAVCVLHNNICWMNEDDVVDFLHEGEDDPDGNGNDDGNVHLVLAEVVKRTHITIVLS